MNKKKIIILSSVSILLIIIAVVIIVVFTGGDKDNTNNIDNIISNNTTESIEETSSTESENITEEKETGTSTVVEKETESTSEIETTEEPTTKKQSSKNYEIVWSNPYFFTKKFSDGTEKYYFTYRANIEMSGKETTAIGVIPPEEIPYLDYEPDYYLNGQTGNPYAETTPEETTGQQTSGNTSNNQTEQETTSGTTPQLVTIDGVQYMMDSDGTLIKLGGGSVSEEEQQKFEEWCEEHGVTMTN